MGRKGENIILVLVLCLCMLGSCEKKDSGRVIPRNTFSKIYAEIFLTDQWMMINSGAGNFPDTTLYYEPIFNKYGFTTDDYFNSVDYYLNDPERFARIVEKASVILESKLNELENAGEKVSDVQNE